MRLIPSLLLLSVSATVAFCAPLKRIDFGPGGSPVADGAIGVSGNTPYAAERGYGWVDAPALEFRDRHLPDPLRRDFVYGGNPARFRVDLPNGLYRVTLTMGDTNYDNHVLTLEAEGKTIVPGLRPKMGEFVDLGFTVAVVDGALDLRFSSPEANWVVNGLAIESASAPGEISTQVTKFAARPALPEIGPKPHSDRLRLTKRPNYASPTYPSGADFMRILERFPLYSERGWHPNYANDSSVGYYGDGTHGEMGLRAMGNYIFVTSLLATDPLYDPRPSGIPRQTLLARARACLAYMTRTHATGDLPCPDGESWGNDWQSAWWTARMAAGARLLWPKLTDAERSAVERVIAHEADRHLDRTPPSGAARDTKSEENAWDSEVLAWAAGMFPDHPHAPAWRAKLQEFAMNTLSAPQDKQDTHVVDGKAVKNWVVTGNIHSDFTIENHGAFHFCYMSCPLHSLAWGYEGITGQGDAAPETMFHHSRDVWRWIKRAYMGDGRFAYLSGKDWPRYGYGLSFVLPVTVLAQIRWGDADARRMEHDRIALLEREQLINSDGSFYGGRYTRNVLGGRLSEYETDTYANIALSYLLHKGHPLLAPTDTQKLARYLSGCWTSAESGWIFGRSSRLFASFSWRDLGGSNGLGIFAPQGCTHMVEWMPGQLMARIGVDGLDPRRATSVHAESQSPLGFSTTGEMRVPSIQGQEALRRQVCFAALPEEGIALVLERATASQPLTVKNSETLNLALANDIFNGSIRKLSVAGKTITLEGARNLGTIEAAEAAANRSSEKLIPLASRWLCVDDRLGVALLDGGSHFVAHDISGRNAPWGSLQYEILGANPKGERRLQAGDTILESAYLLIGGDCHQTARLQQRAVVGSVENQQGVRYALVEAPSGKLYLIVASMDGAPRTISLSVPVSAPSRELRYSADPVRRNGKWWLETRLQFSGFGTEIREVGRRLR